MGYRILVFTLMLFCGSLFSQNHPFYEDIQRFNKLDSADPPPRDAILFIGSSSFTKWTDVQDYFPGKTIINRGFGGSTLSDLNYFADDLLKPYKPKQIVIYCGDNDFAQDGKVMPREVFARFKEFYGKIRNLYPKIPVDYISIKLSPSREKLWRKMIAENLIIKNFLAKQKNAAFIDITKAMEGKDGRVRKDLFLEDHLHMKPEGYRIWAKKIAPYLK